MGVAGGRRVSGTDLFVDRFDGHRDGSPLNVGCAAILIFANIDTCQYYAIMKRMTDPDIRLIQAAADPTLVHYFLRPEAVARFQSIAGGVTPGARSTSARNLPVLQPTA